MPRRPAKVTQGEIARVIRAAKEAGAAEVVIDGEGQIHIVLSSNAPVASPSPAKDDDDHRDQHAQQRDRHVVADGRAGHPHAQHRDEVHDPDPGAADRYRPQDQPAPAGGAGNDPCAFGEQQAQR